jgi:hypothetical protein
MAGTRTLSVVITGDESGAQRAFRNTGAGADTMGSKLDAVGTKMVSVGKKATIGLTLPIVALGVASVKMASDQAESISKSDQIFGRNAGAIHKWASGAASDFGQSRQQAEENAASFGNMFRQLDIGVKPATRMSKSMVELASDFASFHNADITEVLQAQQAAFRGEYDSVQRFVPTIKAATVQTKAMAMTGKENADALTEQDKALATYQLLIDGAGKATGDFDRTADGAANRMRTMTATVTDAGAKIGSTLLPVVAEGAGLVGDLASAFAGLPQPVQTGGLALLGVAAAAGPLLYIGGNLIKVSSGVVSGFTAMSSGAVMLAVKGSEVVDALRAMTLAQVAFASAATLGVVAVGALIVALASSDGPYERITKAAAKWGKTQIDAARGSINPLRELASTQNILETKIASLREKVDSYSTAQTHANMTIEQANARHSENSEQLLKLEKRHQAISPEVARLREEHEKAAAVERIRRQAVEALATGTQTLASTTDIGRQAIADFNNQLIAAAGGPIGYQQAVMNQTAAQEKLNEAVRLHGPFSAEATEATFALQQAQLATSSSAQSMDQAQSTLTNSLAQGNTTYKQQLALLFQQLQAHPENAAGIMLEKEALDRAKAAADALPGSKSVKVDADTSDAEAKLSGVQRWLQEMTTGSWGIRLRVDGA